MPVGEQRDDEEARLVGLADDDAPHLLLHGAPELGGGHPRSGRPSITFHGRPPLMIARTTLHGRAAAGEVGTAS